MSTSAPPSNEIERIWLATRRRVGVGKGGADRRSPSPGVADVLLALHEHGPTHGGEVARRAGRDQGSVTSRWLPTLARRGFVNAVEVPPGEVKPPRHGGGRPARVWGLTERGRELAKALAASTQTPRPDMCPSTRSGREGDQ